MGGHGQGKEKEEEAITPSLTLPAGMNVVLTHLFLNVEEAGEPGFFGWHGGRLLVCGVCVG